MNYNLNFPACKKCHFVTFYNLSLDSFMLHFVLSSTSLPMTRLELLCLIIGRYFRYWHDTHFPKHGKYLRVYVEELNLKLDLISVTITRSLLWLSETSQRRHKKEVTSLNHLTNYSIRLLLVTWVKVVEKYLWIKSKHYFIDT